MNLTIIDPASKFAGHEVRISYGPFSLREAGLALGMAQPIPVIILGSGSPEELETVVEAKHLLITDGPAVHCERCGQPNPALRTRNEFTAERPLTCCCGGFVCKSRTLGEWAVGGPESAELDDDAISALPRVTACCEAHADRAAIALNPNWRALSQEAWGDYDPRSEAEESY